MFAYTLASMILVLAIPDAANSQIGATVLTNGTLWWQGLLVEAIEAFALGDGSTAGEDQLGGRRRRASPFGLGRRHTVW